MCCNVNQLKGNVEITSKADVIPIWNNNVKLTLLFSCFYVMLASNQHPTSSQPHQFTSNIRRILTFSCRSFDQSPTFLQRCIGNIQTTSKSNSKLTLLFSCLTLCWQATNIQRLVNLTSLRQIYVEFWHSVVGLLTKANVSSTLYLQHTNNVKI